MIYQPGTVLFAAAGKTPEWEELSIKDARDYIQQHDLTGEQIKIVRYEGNILVVTKTALELKK